MLLYPRDNGTVSVIITCHDYEHYLDEAIQSVYDQNVMVEIIVVNDAPSNGGKCGLITNKYPNIKLFETNYRNPLLARKHGFEQSHGDYVIFLDADDKLGEYYIEDALNVVGANGIVYSDIQFFGAKEEKTDYASTLDKSRISLTSFIHVGSMVKSFLINISDAFNHPTMKTKYHEDWYFWRKIITSTGCNIIKQKSMYMARVHDTNRSDSINSLSYFDMRGSSADSITTCCIHPEHYNGRFMNEQQWPLESLHELLPKRDILSKAANYTYTSIVQPYQALNYLSKTATTDYIFFYNDQEAYDPDVCRIMLKHMDHKHGIVHDTRYAMLECTMVASLLLHNKLYANVSDFKKEHIKYV